MRSCSPKRGALVVVGAVVDVTGVALAVATTVPNNGVEEDTDDAVEEPKIQYLEYI